MSRFDIINILIKLEQGIGARELLVDIRFNEEND